MNSFENSNRRHEQRESEKKEVAKLAEFNMDYFKELEGEDGWIAIGNEAYSNQRYFTAQDAEGGKLGIIGVYDTEKEKNITHTVVDPKFRGQGLAGKFKEKIMDELGLQSIMLTIDLGNQASIKAAEKMEGIARVSDDKYEKEYNKVKFRYERKGEDEQE